MASLLYKELPDNELRLLYRERLKAEISSSRILTGGLFNTTYFVDSPEAGKTVLRVGPVNRRLLMPFEHDLMRAESEVYRLCRLEGIPVSEVLACDTSKTLIDRDFMIVRYIPSRPMNEIEFTEPERVRIYSDVGRATARFHSITSPRFGRITDVLDGGGYDRWSDCLLAELDSLAGVALPFGVYTEGELASIRGILSKYSGILDEIKTPSLVHTDLWGGNILISESAGRPEFAAIIDADRALWGDAELEFSAVRWIRNREFFSGYGHEPAQTEENRIRGDIYSLMIKLFNKYVYQIEYLEPENEKEEYDEICALIDKLAR